MNFVDLFTCVSNTDFQSKLALKYTQDLYAKARLKLKKVTQIWDLPNFD